MEKTVKNLHSKNRFNRRYDFGKLVQVVPELKSHLINLGADQVSIDFGNPQAVFLLNKALLESEYPIRDWRILAGSLCPSIPSRLNYILYLSDHMTASDRPVRALDIGTGSNLVYPLLGHFEKNWHFVGSEVHHPSIQHARHLLNRNKRLKKYIELRKQEQTEHILQGIIQPGEYFDVVLCNPPFYKSAEDYRATLQKKNQKLHGRNQSDASNFQGLGNELWYPGGEKKFIRQMIYESLSLKDQIGLCSVLISNKDHIKPLRAILEHQGVNSISVIPMLQGNKASRILCWRFDR